MQQQVSLSPIQAYLAKHAFPLLGDNSRKPGETSIFSATDLRQNGAILGYLYIILTGDDYQQLAIDVWQEHVFQSAMWTSLGALLLILLAVLGLVYVITRKLKALTLRSWFFNKPILSAVCMFARK